MIPTIVDFTEQKKEINIGNLITIVTRGRARATPQIIIKLTKKQKDKQN